MPSDSQINRGPSSAPSPLRESVKSADNADNLKAVRDAGGAREAYQEAFGVENAQESTGRVSEILSETAGEDIPAGTGAQTTTKDDSNVKSQQHIKAELLKNIPSESVLKKQIRKEIEAEIYQLHKKAMGMMRSPSKVNFFELTNMLRKIRDLKGILSELFKASFESLKTLWLRYVHGIM